MTNGPQDPSTAVPKEIFEKLGWLFVLLPGFLCFSVIGSIVELGELSEFQITFYSLVLTLVVDLVAIGVLAMLAALQRRLPPGGMQWLRRTTTFYATAVTVAIVSGIGLGLAAENDMFFKALRWLPVTDVLNKASAKRPLNLLLSQNTAGQLRRIGDARPKEAKQTEAWARVHMKEGDTFEGWPEFYGSGNSPSEIYLSPACRVDGHEATASVEKIQGPGVILVEAEIRAIELLDRASSRCYALYYPQASPTAASTPSR